MMYDSSTQIVPKQHMNHPELKAHDLQRLLLSFPNRDNVQKQTAHLKTLLRKEMELVRADIAEVATCVEVLEQSHLDLQHHVTELSSKEAKIEQRHIKQFLLLHDLEKRQHINNDKIKGIPKSIKNQDLLLLTITIFYKYLERPEDTTMDIDQAHRLTGPSRLIESKSRDVICRIHFYRQRSNFEISFGKGPLHLQDMTVTLWPDFSKHTILKRNKLI